MRFKLWPRYSFRDTPRNRAAVLRCQKREREALSLFADEIQDQQPNVDDVMAARAARWTQREQDGRAHRALKWRQSRARLARYPDRERSALLAYWQRCGWPADPVYLLEMLHMFDTGRLDLQF